LIEEAVWAKNKYRTSFSFIQQSEKESKLEIQVDGVLVGIKTYKAKGANYA
jgi:hypothetical protein